MKKCLNQMLMMLQENLQNLTPAPQKVIFNDVNIKSDIKFL